MNDIFPKIRMKLSAARANIQKSFNAYNQRKFERFVFDKGVVYALISWDELKEPVLMGQLIDINMEGCGIYYIIEKNTAITSLWKDTCKLRIISTLRMYELQKNTIVYDNELAQFSTEKISFRQCGIKFDAPIAMSYNM